LHDTSVAYAADAWHEFFIGSAGGVAALSGLIAAAAINAWVLLVEVMR
jgi:phosphoribosylcarboxyaminoimidazole (NCAIR) mutase